MFWRKTTDILTCFRLVVADNARFECLNRLLTTLRETEVVHLVYCACTPTKRCFPVIAHAHSHRKSGEQELWQLESGRSLKV